MKKPLQDKDCPSHKHGFTNHAEMSYSFQQSCSFKLQKIKHLVMKTISRDSVAKLDKQNKYTHTIQHEISNMAWWSIYKSRFKITGNIIKW